MEAEIFLWGDEVGEELVDFGRSHIPGMASDNATRFQFRVVKVDVFLHPSDVGITGAREVMFEVDGIAIKVKESFSLWRGRFFFRSWEVSNFVAFFGERRHIICVSAHNLLYRIIQYNMLDWVVIRNISALSHSWASVKLVNYEYLVC